MRPLETIRGFLYGLTGLEFERQALEMRGSLETIFFVTTLGDMLGLPIIPPVYSLRVLPYAVPHIATWKRRGVRGRAFSAGERIYPPPGLPRAGRGARRRRSKKNAGGLLCWRG